MEIIIIAIAAVVGVIGGLSIGDSLGSQPAPSSEDLFDVIINNPILFLALITIGPIVAIGIIMSFVNMIYAICTGKDLEDPYRNGSDQG